MIEMQEMSFILNNVGPKSLVIIDELGRGTSVEEGSSLCWAMCEKLLESSAYIFIATHFMFMTLLADVHPCVTNHHFLSKTVDDQVEYTHQLAKGKPPKNNFNYGIDLASKTSLPESIIKKAKEFSEQIREENLTVPPRNPLDTACIDLVVKLKRLVMSGVKGKERADAMKQLKYQFLAETSSNLSQEDNADVNPIVSNNKEGNEEGMECSSDEPS